MDASACASATETKSATVELLRSTQRAPVLRGRLRYRDHICHSFLSPFSISLLGREGLRRSALTSAPLTLAPPPVPPTLILWGRTSSGERSFCLKHRRKKKGARARESRGAISKKSKPFWKVTSDGSSKGYGVVGIVLIVYMFSSNFCCWNIYYLPNSFHTF
ncbi:uncharacterized protein LOC130140106 [Syzygium oleosum]|uniref:uncharacterized protein LOC130140106 n=1 Tax=Syzygium oleosum TaxID=219896 RepID=UPI0024BAD8DB|nr:uncharacterized protein LOC130140106 [Syzygium oleosum]